MKKRLLSALLVLAMVFSMLPITSYAATVSYDSSSSKNTTITVTDQSGDRVTNATVTVTRSTNDYEVYNAGNGQYKFTRDRTNSFYSYTIEVSAPNHSTETVTVRGNASSTTVSLTYEGPEIVTVNIFYIADGSVPSSYAGAGDSADYGPSANNTPLVQINVNITMLREIAAQANSPVLYREGNNTTGNNQWEFVPSGSRNDENYMDHVRAFWDAMISCTEDTSIEAFKATGLYDTFECYCLKKQNDGSIHGDGVLSVKPPVYVVELYEQHIGTNNQPVFFGGGVSDDTMTEEQFLSPDDILQQYKDHLGLNITWVEDAQGKPLFQDNYFTGHYIDGGYYYTIKILQLETGNAQTYEKNDIYYIKRTDTYYLARFNMEITKAGPVSYLVTYTDGAANEVVFTDHEYPAKRDEPVPAFTGATIRPGYIFQGWYLAGSSSTSTVYSAEQIAAMTVTGDMTFHAVWAPVPEYVGKVILVCNGAFNSTTGELTSGQLIDPGTVLSITDPISLAVSADGANYIPLESSQTGVYSATLENGTYYTYYTTNGGKNYLRLSTQPLIIENADRTRYLFFNSVTYELNGGTLNDSDADFTEYHRNGSAVSVNAATPVREGYLFLGWSVNGNTVQPGNTLTDAINAGYTLSAQWVKTQDVYVSFTINHKVHNDPGMRQLPFTLDMRLKGSTGDYTEIYADRLVPGTWTNNQTVITDAQGNAIYQGEMGERNADGITYRYTKYIPTVPVLRDMRSDMEYYVTSHKADYTITKITPPKVDANGDLWIHVELEHTPEKFELTYNVTLDEDAKDLDPSLWPKAVNVKVSKWDAQQKQWLPIVHHTDTYERVELDATGKGTGRFSVWQYANQDSNLPYYHRIEVVSFELPDGTIVSASDTTADVTFVSENKRFFANVTVTNGENPENATSLAGAYWNGTAQQGEITAIVSIPVYTVTLEPNGGRLNGSEDPKVLTNQIITPDVSQYVPIRGGNYVFDGWYLVEDGVMTDKTVSANDPLTSDITLRAKWKPPITVSGLITVAGAYELTEDGVTTWHTIPESERTPTLIVLLQKKTPSGYYETINQQFCSLDYNNPDYYFQGRIVGWVDYAFENLPDNGEYRISVLSSNYTASYQNEDESVDAWKQYDKYTPGDYVALHGETDPTTLTVNAHLHFTPPSFDLEYEVDASQIGTSFRPDGVNVLITCRPGPKEFHPSQWPVISQMIQNGTLIGKRTDLDAAGLGSDSQSVWKTSYDGFTLYDYGLRVQSTVKDNVTTDYTENRRYTVVYQSPAYFNDTTGEQSQPLKATLVPNTYKVTYDTNGGTIYGTHVTSHKWSYETVLTEVTPIRPGYEFAGWYLDENMEEPAGNTISAGTDHDVTFYAKWVAAHTHLVVVIDHTAPQGGVATNYDKLLTAQLTRRDADSEDIFVPVDGQIRTYDSSVWHSDGNGIYADGMEIIHAFTGLSTAYDYNANVTLDGYKVVPSYTYQTTDENDQPIEQTIETGVEKSGAWENDAWVIHHEIVVCLKFDPDMMDLSFSVEMAEDVESDQYPASAQLKVTAWYDHPEIDGSFDWYPITQHTNSAVTVPISPNNGIGTGSAQFPVWSWFNGEFKMPYYYRLELVSVTLNDGTVVSLANAGDHVSYAGSGYSATVYAENGCATPIVVTAAGSQSPADTALTGVYASLVGDTYVQTGTLKAVIDVGKLVFHTGDKGSDIFRTYYPIGATEPIYNLNPDGTVPEGLRYDIPTFDYLTHNEYIFKGWYDESGTPIDWNTFALTGTDPVHLYAHWFETGEVQQSDDGKQLPQEWNGTYQGFDTVGIQIRTARNDDQPHHGTPGPGLRFIAVLRQELYSQINALPGNEAGAEYGFALGKTESITALEAGIRGVTMFKCSGVPDHYSNVDGNTGYRLYTCVITYDSVAANPEALAKAQNTAMAARAYIRYYDANGLYRTYYNNYTGKDVYGGCSASYNDALRMLRS